TRLFADAERSDIRNEADGAADKASAAGIQGTPTLLVQIGTMQPYAISLGSAEEMRAALDDAISG
ncbi:MAG TPA: hypothetical protein VHI53_09435, partial [Gaiellaceae bacterium]|nr:hypothetical protein [Gaiellaceae bacterium]